MMNNKQRRAVIREIRRASKHIAQKGLRNSDQVGERRRIARELNDGVPQVIRG